MVKKVKIKTSQETPTSEGEELAKELEISGDEIGYSKVLASWDFPEYQKYAKGVWWYIIVFIISVGLILWATLSQQNYLFVGIIVIALIIIVFASRREPAILNIKITEDGIIIGEKLYHYSRIKKFWIAYQPPVVKKLYLKLSSTIKPVFSISLENTNPLEIRKILLNYLEEDIEQDGETASDAWERLLKL